MNRIIQLLNIMKTAHEINDSFRKEIRSRQKQVFFNNIRAKYQQQSKTQPLSHSSPHKMQMVSQTTAQAHTLHKLVEEVRNTDGTRICNKIIDEGVHQQLINNLKSNLNIAATLELISAIISKEKVKIVHKFVKLGLVEEVLKLSQTRMHVDVCMNILANTVFENVEYAEMMLENNVQRHAFGLFRGIVQGRQTMGKEDQDSGFSIMWMLAALLDAENTMEYKQQFLEILNFAMEVLKTQHYIGLIIQMIFLVGYSFREQTQSTASWAINAILSEASTKSRYIENLLITIKLLSPMDIDYSKITTLATLAEGKLVSYCIRILQKIVDKYPNHIPNNLEWWEHLYLKIQKPQDMQCYTLLLKKSKIRSEFVYHILYQILENYPSSYLTLTNEVLICLNSLLELSLGNAEQKNKVKFYIRSSNIYQKLQKLYENKNPDIHHKCEYLLIAFSM